MRAFKFLYILFFVASCHSVFADRKTDSLYKLLSTRIADTARIDVYNEFCWPVYSFSNIDSSLKYGEKAIELSSKIGDTIRLIIAYRRVGIAYINKADHKNALSYQLKSYNLARAINYKKGIASALNNMSVIYLNISDFKKAIDYGLQSQRIQEELKDSSNLFQAYYNTALLFKNIEDLKNAKQFYIKAYNIAKHRGESDQQAFAMAGLATIFKKEKKYETSQYYYLRAEQLFKADNHLQGLSEVYINLGGLYAQWDAVLKNIQLRKALAYYSKAYSINQQYHNQITASNILGNMAHAYVKLDKTDSVIYYASRAVELATQVGDKAEVVFSAKLLSDAYLKKGNYPLSIKYLNIHISLKDSIFNYEKQKDIEQKQMKFDFEKKMISDSLRVVEEKRTTTEKLNREKTIRYSLILFVILLVAFSFIMFNRFKVIKKQKNIILEQKDVVEEKQKEIIDSINYAKRIQHALLANENLLNNFIPDHFVFFKPKDIVSGDFYWATKKEDRFYLAVCDSTGHGVPGAFMSLLNMSFLNEAINEKNIEQPNKILNHVRQRLIENMDGGKDGMDAILICCKVLNNGKLDASEILYAAANNEPILVRDGIIVELPKDKMPVGIGERKESFTLQSLSLEKGDSLFLYTDGFADQFGGPKGKKFKYRPLNEMLASMSATSFDQHEQLLETTFNNWKGDLEQIDDVCIIGLHF